MCCKYKRIELSLEQVHNLHMISVLAIQPPQGFGIKLCAPIEVRINGSFIMSTFGSIEGTNGIGTLVSIPSAYLLEGGLYSVDQSTSYKINTSDTGAVYLSATSEISGGSSGSYIAIDLWYCLVEG